MSNTTTEGYKPIKVNKNNTPEVESLTVTLEDVTSEEPVQQEPSIEVDIESGEVVKQPAEEPKTSDEQEPSETTAEGTPQPQKKKKAQAKKKDKKPSRARERIRQLHGEKTELQQQLEQERAEIAALKAQLQEGSKESKTTLKGTLENNIENILVNMRKAMEEGDADASVKLNKELTETQMQLAGIEAELHTIEKTPVPEYKAPVEQTQQNQQDLPEKAYDWIEAHPQFDQKSKEHDPYFQQAAVFESQRLLQEGFDMNDDDYYEELNSRLGPRFPEVFGIDEQNDVNYTEEQDENNASLTEDDKETVQTKPEQTVAGASRTQTKGPKRGTKKDSVVLSPDMIQHAQRWGLSLDQLARRVAHNEKHKQSGGYVPIQINKKKQ